MIRIGSDTDIGMNGNSYPILSPGICSINQFGAFLLFVSDNHIIFKYYPKMNIKSCALIAISRLIFYALYIQIAKFFKFQMEKEILFI